MDFNQILTYLKTIFSFDASHPLLFTQFYFWAFFAIVFAFFSLIYSRKMLRNTFLFFVSLFFYFKTSGLFVLILIFSTFFNYFFGKSIHRVEYPLKKKIILGFAIFVNLFVLFYFKYAYFFTDVYNNLFHTNSEVFNYLAYWTNSTAGTHFSVDKILLPVGISFYTFQAISYIVDVYRKQVLPIYNMFDFGFYVSFFPGLVAGPIVRASNFVPQIYKKYLLSKMQFGIAVFWILNGLLKKMILSDYLAVNFIDRVFTNPLMYTGFENLMALFGYSLQVYADFSGYTDIAIGLALLMGFQLPKNFDSPYKATNPGNFWKRWHISLSSWLKDYLYIPLGGNRKGGFATYFIIFLILAIIIFLANNVWVTIGVFSLVVLVAFVFLVFPSTKRGITTNINLMNTMLLGGLWHGASWNFMIWGGLNGIGILSFKFWRNLKSYQKVGVTFLLAALFLFLDSYFKQPVYRIGLIWTAIIFGGTLLGTLYSFLRKGKILRRANQAWSIFLTFVFITFTRLFFRSGSNLNPSEANETAWNTAKNMVNKIGGEWDFSLIPSILYEYAAIFLLFALGMIIHWLPEKMKRKYRINFALLPQWLQLVAVVVVVFVIYQFITADLQSFIYFQF